MRESPRLSDVPHLSKLSFLASRLDLKDAAFTLESILETLDAPVYLNPDSLAPLTSQERLDKIRVLVEDCYKRNGCLS